MHEIDDTFFAKESFHTNEPLKNTTLPFCGRAQKGKRLSRPPSETAHGKK